MILRRFADGLLCQDGLKVLIQQLDSTPSALSAHLEAKR